MKALKHIGIFLLLLGVASCHTQKSIPNLPTDATSVKVSQVITAAKAQQPQFVHLSIQSRIEADIDRSSTSLAGRIYIKNGEKIWVNVSKFGINAARAEITPAGFKAYEKIERTYIDGDFSYFNDLLKVDFIDYDKLQNLLLGRLFVDLKPNEFEMHLADNQFVLSHIDNQKLENKPKNGKYIQTYYFDSKFRLSKVELKDPKSGMELEISYRNWTKVGVQDFPKNVKVLVKDQKTQQVDLEYNNFTFSETATPFAIPSGYKPNKILK